MAGYLEDLYGMWDVPEHDSNQSQITTLTACPMGQSPDLTHPRDSPHVMTPEETMYKCLNMS